MSAEDTKSIARNRKAGFEYEVIDKYEAGLVLEGSEVKSLRDGGVSIEEAFVVSKGGELFIVNMKVPTYRNAGGDNPEVTRQRKLLLHGKQISRITRALAKKGYTCVPLSLYFRRGYAKVEIALVKPRSRYDKREKIKKRDTQREMERYLKRR
ncbi:MAG: SsrA-binding protein SmpB [Planctomycetes bacterium]|nr:SsrA-binding protein SmpB [Planctomycetota bacterium]